MLEQPLSKGNELHGIETAVVDGEQVAAATYLRDPAWHRLGTVLTEPLSTRDSMDVAYLSNWNVRLEPLVAAVEEDLYSLDEQYVVLRDNPFTGDREALATVGGRYEVLQNEVAFDFADSLIDSEDAQWESMFSIHGGKTVAGTLLLPREIVIDPQGANDRVSTHLLVSTSHDGTSPLEVAIVPNRVDCANMLRIARKSAKSKFRIRHTGKTEGRIAAAREALGMSYKYLDAVEAEAKALFETEFTSAQFLEAVERVYPKPDPENKRGTTRWENKVDLIVDLYSGGGDVPFTNATITGTAWGAMNAMTERLDWHRKGRGDGSEERLLIATTGLGLQGDLLGKAKSEIRQAVLDVAREVNPNRFDSVPA